MNGEQLLTILGGIDYELIEEAKSARADRRPRVPVYFVRAAVFLALFCGILTASILLWEGLPDPYVPTDLSFFTIDGGRLIAYAGTDAEVYIPESVTEISSTAFAHNLTVTSVTVPGTTTKIDTAAFTGCTNLQTITVAEDNPAYLSVEGVVFSGDGKTLLAYPAGNTQAEYTVPSFVETVASSAFTWNSHLTTVHISEGVTTVAAGAFSYCDSLASVTLPASVEDIAAQAFTDCRTLREILVSGENSHYSDKDGVLFADGGRILHTYPSGREAATYEIPEGTAVVMDHAFSYSKVEKVFFPASLKSMHHAVFAFSSVNTVTFHPDTVLLSISLGVFENAAVHEVVHEEVITKHGFCKDGGLWTNERYLSEKEGSK